MEIQEFACPIYMQALNDMISEIDKEETIPGKLCIYATFAEKYTMLADDWSKFLREINDHDILIEVTGSDRYHHLYSRYHHLNKPKKHVDFLGNIDALTALSRYRTTENEFEEAEKFLNFPHASLYHVYQAYINRYPKPFSKNITIKYQKNNKLYEKIKNCENDIDEWLQCMEEIEDSEAVMANFELKLGQGQNWINHKIWGAYFNILKKHNLKEILDVYRKYTRLFISDKEAVEIYRNEIEKLSSWNERTTHFWIDTIKWEMDFGDLKFAYILLQRAVKAVLGKNIQFKCTKTKDDLIDELEQYGAEMEKMEHDCQHYKSVLENLHTESEPPREPITFSNNPIKQVFPFRQSFIQHLLKSANGYVLRKLYATCKFFFSLQPTPLCYRLELSRRYKNEIWKETISINKDAFECPITPALDNLHVYEKIYTESVGDFKLLSTVIQKLHRCDVYKIHITRQDLTLNEYKFMISKNIRQIYLNLVNIYEDKNETLIVDGKCLFDLANVFKKLEFFELLNSQDLFSFSNYKEILRLPILDSAASFHGMEFHRIYIEGQELDVQTLLKLLNTTVLKMVTLQNVIIEDERENMTKETVIDLIKENVLLSTYVKVF